MKKIRMQKWAMILVIACAIFGSGNTVAQEPASGTIPPRQAAPVEAAPAPAAVPVQQAPAPAAQTQPKLQPIQMQPDEPTIWQNIIGFFFPSLRVNQPDPSDTLQAPFADLPPPPEGAAPKIALPINATPMDKPHRRVAEISEWLTRIVTESTTLVTPNYKGDIDKASRYYSAEGKGMYQDFLQQAGISKALESGQYYVRSFVRDVPVTLNEGAVAGHYRWLYEVPVMITYLPRDTTGYKNAEPVNVYMMLNIQVGRAENAPDEIGLLVERLTYKVQKEGDKSGHIGK
jgi:intracellular multiplication protein IcmL